MNWRLTILGMLVAGVASVAVDLVWWVGAGTTDSPWFVRVPLVLSAAIVFMKLYERRSDGSEG